MYTSSPTIFTSSNQKIVPACLLALTYFFLSRRSKESSAGSSLSMPRKFLLCLFLLVGVCDAGGYGSAPGEDEECDEAKVQTKAKEDGLYYIYNTMNSPHLMALLFRL
jgi:hypothetical protein